MSVPDVITQTMVPHYQRLPKGLSTGSHSDTAGHRVRIGILYFFLFAPFKGRLRIIYIWGFSR